MDAVQVARRLGICIALEPTGVVSLSKLLFDASVLVAKLNSSNRASTTRRWFVELLPCLRPPGSFRRSGGPDGFSLTLRGDQLTSGLCLRGSGRRIGYRSSVNSPLTLIAKLLHGRLARLAKLTQSLRRLPREVLPGNNELNPIGDENAKGLWVELDGLASPALTKTDLAVASISRQHV